MPLIQGWENSPEIATLDEALAFCGLEDFQNVFESASLQERSPEQVREVQQQARDAALERADAAFGVFLQFTLARTNLDAIAVEAFRDATPGTWENKGLVDVAVTLPGDVEVTLKVTYLLQQAERRRGPKKRHGNRGPTGRGVYPALEVLGIDSHRRLTPLLEEEILVAGLSADAFRVGLETIERHGYHMSWTGFLNRFHNAGAARFEQHRKWLDDGLGEPRFDGGAWRGHRIIICPDGGRARTRENYPGRPRKSGYHGFDAPWKEPKLFIIYAVDDEGRMLQEPRPIVDGVIGENDEFECPADELFDVLSKTLMALNICDAASVSVLGDGADWIWNRARPMLLELGVEPEKIFELIDWYHVESGIWTLSTLPTKWSKHRQISWRNRVLAHLHDGEIDAFIEQLGELDVPSEKAEDHQDVPRKDFFTKNGERLRYDQARAANLPEGSGAIESVIRRVVNLRLKGNSKYWTEENAAHTMFLRAQLRTGRFDSFMRWARAQQAVWWTQADRSRLETVEDASDEAQEAA